MIWKVELAEESPEYGRPGGVKVCQEMLMLEHCL